MAQLLLPAYYRRILSPSECFNPLSPNCSSCRPIELTLGTCAALADTPSEANLGLVTAWGMFFCFLIPIVGVITRRTKIFWAGLTSIWAIILAAIFQATIPSKRPDGACMAEGTTCGMPSGHVITAYATITFLFLMWGRDLLLKGLRQCMNELCTVFGVILTFIVSVFVVIQILMPVGRFVIKYHTSDQVGFGVLTGMAIGVLWFFLVLKVFGPYVGPKLEKYLKCISVNDDWTHTGEHIHLKSKRSSEQSLMSSAADITANKV